MQGQKYFVVKNEVDIFENPKGSFIHSIKYIEHITRWRKDVKFQPEAAGTACRAICISIGCKHKITTNISFQSLHVDDIS